ncbi:Gpi1-domain-containing protein [Microstroma glucosiphilum]|uniref:Gpi1-domain-containing protein n=1 Tax=Pseudomicrostroma glucosiphilum TaxID=1684307 RepID=A0A316U7H7_9BASI|nr:Gpi1-domain-containing protein [Pseudomicrostroma glucosiphilum]PWN20804.1 Gpi1-domain-containing protein [Pseudomicrostroma glucosiphilum]
MNRLDSHAVHGELYAGPSAAGSYLKGIPSPNVPEDDANASTATLPSSPRWPLEHISIFVPEDLHRIRSHRAGSASPPQAQLLLTGWAARGGPGEVLIVICDSITPQQAAERGLESVDHLRGAFGLVGTLKMAQSGVGPLPKRADAKGKGKERSTELEEGIWIHATAQLRPRRGRSAWSGCSIDISSVSLFEGGQDAASHRPAISLISFQPPRPSSLRFLSLEPLSAQSVHNNAGTEAEDLGAKLEMLIATRTHRWFEVTGGFANCGGPGNGLRQAVEFINACQQYRTHWKGSSQCALLEKPGPSVARRITSYFALSLASGAGVIRPLLVKRFASLPTLSSISRTAAQLSHRLNQVGSLPSSAAELRRLRRHDRVPIRYIAARYISVWNGLWLVMNDLILGWAVGSILCDHHASIAAKVTTTFETLLGDWLLSALRWLDDWPGGLKLNTELSAFYTDMYSGLVSLFQAMVLSPLLSSLPSLILYIGQASKLLGLSGTICLLSDVLTFSTMHISALHTLSRTQYRATLHLLSFLLFLFRGKKRNILLGSRSGSSSAASYELDQLLLGTILFTLVLFLSPTIIVYHALFASAKIAQEILIEGILGVAVQGLNALPLFAVLLLLKDKQRVPGGVIVESVQDEDLGSENEVQGQGLLVARYRLRSRPLSFWEVITTTKDDNAVAEDEGGSRRLPGKSLRALPTMVAAVCTGQEIKWRG